MAPLDPEKKTTAEIFAELAVELHDAPGVAETVEAVVAFALDAVGCAHAGVVLARHGRPSEVAAISGAIIGELYQSQIDSADGPIFHALATTTALHVPDVSTETRWPGWADKAHAAGICSVVHVPMRASDQTIGLLSLFSTQPQYFGIDDEAIAHIMAQHAAVAVAAARQDERLTAAVDARRIIGQAMGILMERFNVDGDRAFAILRRYSQGTNTKLHDVAEQLIETRRLPTDPPRR